MSSDGDKAAFHANPQYKPQSPQNTSNDSQHNLPQASESSTKKVVRVGSIFTTSNSKTFPSSTKNESDAPSSPGVSSDNFVINKYTLLTAWNSLSKDTNQFDNASIVRIGSVEPIFIDENHFEISVANPNVESFFNENRNKILKALSTHLNNKIMEMSIRFIADSDSHKILSPIEQVKEMIFQNPSFGKLKDNLDLSL